MFTVNFTEYGLGNDLPSLDMDGAAHNGTWSSLFKSSTPVAGGLANSAKAKCSGGQFVCDLPNRNLFKWFGVLTSLVLVVKAIVNLKCLLFSLGLPGLFGRNFLIYADQLNDNTGEPIYHIQTNPCLVLLQTSLVVLRLVFVAPFLWLLAFARFYSRKHDSPKETIKRQSATNIRAEQKESKKVEKVAKAPETEANGDAKAAKNGDSKKEKKEEPKKEEPKKEEANKKEKEEKPKEKEVPKAKEVPKVEEVEEISTPLIARPAQNWSDLFFIIDSLSYNIDACDLILFVTKINPIPGLENKKVNVDVSYLDTSSNTLVISHTDSGIIESLLDTELSTA